VDNEQHDKEQRVFGETGVNSAVDQFTGSGKLNFVYILHHEIPPLSSFVDYSAFPGEPSTDSGKDFNY
jgi:hypothetical protein